MSSKDNTRERLLDAAEKVFAEKGYHEAAVDEIVLQSGTSKGSVYFHFPSKESLFLAVMDHLSARLLKRIERDVERETDPTERLRVALRTTVETLCKHRTLARLLLSKGQSMGPAFVQKRQEVFSRFAMYTKGLMDEALGQSLQSIDTEVAAYALLGAVSELVTRWLESGRPHPVREAMPTLETLVLRGIGLTKAEARS